MSWSRTSTTTPKIKEPVYGTMAAARCQRPAMSRQSGTACWVTRRSIVVAMRRSVAARGPRSAHQTAASPQHAGHQRGDHETNVVLGLSQHRCRPPAGGDHQDDRRQGDGDQCAAPGPVPRTDPRRQQRRRRHPVEARPHQREVSNTYSLSGRWPLFSRFAKKPSCM